MAPRFLHADNQALLLGTMMSEFLLVVLFAELFKFLIIDKITGIAKALYVEVKGAREERP